jgi:hypothetical protein
MNAHEKGIEAAARHTYGATSWETADAVTKEDVRHEVRALVSRYLAAISAGGPAIMLPDEGVTPLTESYGADVWFAPWVSDACETAGISLSALDHIIHEAAREASS